LFRIQLSFSSLFLPFVMATLSLQKYRGALALQGPEIDQMATSALISSVGTNSFLSIDPHCYHITLLTKLEISTITPDQIGAIKPDTRHIFAIGVGGKPSSGVYWVVIIWTAGKFANAFHQNISISPCLPMTSMKSTKALHPSFLPFLPDRFEATSWTASSLRCSLLGNTEKPRRLLSN
jgi:hypothetical protein